MAAVGFGYDVHPLAEGRKLILGGVEIEHERGLAGHSDADVLTHAVIDALLGAAALGDIGTLYPDTEERYRDIESILLLHDTRRRLWGRNMTIRNVDVTVVMERPKLAPYRDRIRQRLAEALALRLDQVSVKATRGEGMGFVGREEGVAAMAVAAVEDRTAQRYH